MSLHFCMENSPTVKIFFACIDKQQHVFNYMAFVFILPWTEVSLPFSMMDWK